MRLFIINPLDSIINSTNIHSIVNKLFDTTLQVERNIKKIDRRKWSSNKNYTWYKDKSFIIFHASSKFKNWIDHREFTWLYVRFHNDRTKKLRKTRVLGIIAGHKSLKPMRANFHLSSDIFTPPITHPFTYIKSSSWPTSINRDTFASSDARGHVSNVYMHVI